MGSTQAEIEIGPPINSVKNNSVLVANEMQLVRCAQCGGACAESEAAAAAAAAPAGRDGGWACTAAELLATTLLVALSCLVPRAAPDAPLLTRALASGLVVTMLVQCFDHISGAFMNPTVTLAAVLRGRVAPKAGLVYVGAQLLGSALAPPLVLLLQPVPAAAPLRDPGLTLPAHNVPLYKVKLPFYLVKKRQNFRLRTALRAATLNGSHPGHQLKICSVV
ncbi:hypothetical protein ACJJTC_005938 [Scirpophaga incertulas]